MKTKILLIVCYLATLITYVVAQTPGFNYQAVLRDVQGEVMPNVEITMFITLTEGPAGPILYRENQKLVTTELGILNTIIGEGEVETGEYANIIGVQNLHIELQAEIPGEPDVVDIGNSSIGATPLALYGEDADSDPNNEMQSLSLEGDSLKISGTPGISLASIKTPWQRIEDGYELDFGSNRRDDNLNFTELRITEQDGLSLGSEDKTHLLNYCGSVLWDGKFLRDIRSGVMSDILTPEELAMIAENADKSEDVIGSSVGKVDRAGGYLAVEAMSADLDGFTMRGLGDSYQLTGQFGEKCFQKTLYGDRILSNNFFDGAANTHGLNFYNASGAFGGGLFAAELATLGAFNDLAAIGGQNFTALISSNTAGGDIISFSPEGHQATRATSLTDLGGVFLVYDNQGNEKIRIACDSDGSAGIWFGSERVLGSSQQIQAKKISDEGTIQLVDGSATVMCSHEFTSLADPAKMTIQLTPLSSESKGLAVIQKFDGGFKVKELSDGKGSYQVDWSVRSQISKDIDHPHGIPEAPAINRQAHQHLQLAKNAIN